jgi:O-acetylserine/cysteine efflux transporter
MLLVGIGSAHLLLGESISGIEIAGSMSVFGGLLVSTFGLRLAKCGPQAAC